VQEDLLQDLSPALRDTWRFFIWFLQENGFQPSLKDIEKRFNITNGAAQGRLEGLRKKGWLKFNGSKSRAYILPRVKIKVEYV